MMEVQNTEKVFIGKASGKNSKRKDFSAMTVFIRVGDAVFLEGTTIHFRRALTSLQ